MTTLLRYAGDLSPRALSDAFMRTDEELYKEKGVTLIDNAYDRTIDYLANNKHYENKYGVVLPSSEILHLNIDAYVQGIVLNLYEDNRWSEERGSLLSKSLMKYEKVA